MSSNPPDFYDVLGVKRSAKNVDIGRAYNRLVREYQSETSPPDAKRDARLKEAFDTLTDEERRNAYDASLVVGRAKAGGKNLGIAVGATALLLGGGYFALQAMNAPTVVPDKPLQEIQMDAARSLGRLQTIDVSGKSTTVGLAFGIADGVMVSTCAGVTPGALLTVSLASRNAPARVTETDAERGLCKLAVDGGGTWALPISGSEAVAGDKVYVPKMNAAGDVSLVEAQVKRINVADPKVRLVETSVAMGPEQGGGPLIDRFGRVVAIASTEGRPMAFPKAWAADKTRAMPEPAPAPQAVATPAPAAADPEKLDLPPGAAAKLPVELSEAQKKRLSETLRPPPKLPDDL